MNHTFIIKLTLSQINEWERLANRLADEQGTDSPDVKYCEVKVLELQNDLENLKS